jgi:hypothetical protein
MVIKTVSLDDDQLNTILYCLSEKRDDLEVVLKNPDGLEPEALRDLQIQHRDINTVMRELQFYTEALH